MSYSIFVSPSLKQDVQTTLACWLTCLVLIVGQCSFGAYFVYASQPDIVTDLLWYVESWGIWLIVTPFLFGAYHNRASTGSLSLRDMITIGSCAFLAAFIFQLIVKVIIEESILFAHAVNYFIPRYCAATLGVTLVWIWRYRRLLAKLWIDSNNSLNISVNQQDTEEENTLLVYKGRDKALIKINNIQGVIAAKNYLEILCHDGEYLIRGTIKNMESFLPPAEFIRTHRSALVRRSSVIRFKTLSSGNGLAILQNGSEIPVNKNFMLSLNRYDKISDHIQS